MQNTSGAVFGITDQASPVIRWKSWLCKVFGMGGIMSCDYVQQYYGVPACIGRRVVAYGKPGVIAEDRGNYIGILLDSDKPGNVNNYHPVDGIVYLDEKGKVRKPVRSQARYQRFIEYGDCFDSFIEFCRWDALPEHTWNGCRA